MDSIGPTGDNGQVTADTTPQKIEVPLPPGFDPRKHGAQLVAYIEKNYGPGYELTSINMEKNTAFAFKQAEMNEMKEEGNAIQVKLTAAFRKPSAGEQVAAKFEEQHPGYFLVKFEPFVGRAVLAKMSDDELRARGALAEVVGVKPWDVAIQKRRGGGFNFKLPKYTPSKHDDKLLEVAESVVGKFGWYVEVDSNTLQGAIIPSEPPTFPGVVPFPMDSVKPVTRWDKEGDKERFTFDLALGLGDPGQPNIPVKMSLDDSTAILTVGLPGSGKSVAVQSIVAQALIKGYRLAVINTPAKKTDYTWAKPYVYNNWWGCDDQGTSVAEALTVATLVDEEGKRMGALLEQHRVGKWQDLPEEVKKANPPVFVVADELANLLNKPNIPGGLTKEAKALPQFVQMAQDYLEAKLLTVKLNALVAVHRAAGVRELYLTQRPSKTEGFPPELKSLIPHRVLLGPTPSEADVAMAFRDAKRVSRVPNNVAVDPAASRGAGIAHLDGSEPVVIKGFFAPGSEFEKLLQKHLGKGDPSDSRVRPTAEQIARCVPKASGDEFDEDEQPLDTKRGERAPSGRSAREIAEAMGDTQALSNMDSGLTGFEKANAMRNQAAGGGQTRSQREAAKEEARNAARSGDVTSTKMAKCDDCGGWVNPVTGKCMTCGAEG